MDLNRLSKGELLMGATGLILFLLSFFPLWAKYELEGGAIFADATGRYSAWTGYGFLMKIALILALAGVVLVLMKAAGTLDNVQLPVTLGLIYLIVAGLVALIMLLYLLIGPIGESGLGVEVSRGPLLFVGIALGLAMAGGAFMHFQQEGGTAATTRRPGPPAGTPPPPPGA